MPGVRTASYLNKRVRSGIGIYDKQKVVDGWLSEVGIFPDAPSILDELNWALNDLTSTGFNKCKFTLPLVALTANYPMPRAAHNIPVAWLQDSTGRAFDLIKTSMEALREEWRGTGWMNIKSNRPQRYYNIGTKAICVWPIPTTTQYTLYYYADTVVEDMTAPTDVPAVMRDSNGSIMIDSDGQPMSNLPEEYHEHICIGAEAKLLRSLGRGAEADAKFREWNGKEDARDGQGGVKFNLAALVNDRQKPDMERLNLTGMSRRSVFGAGYR